MRELQLELISTPGIWETSAARAECADTGTVLAATLPLRAKALFSQAGQEACQRPSARSNTMMMNDRVSNSTYGYVYM